MAEMGAVNATGAIGAIGAIGAFGAIGAIGAIGAMGAAKRLRVVADPVRQARLTGTISALGAITQ